MNLPSIKRAGSPHYTVIRLKTSFCSATYRPKAHRPIYRDLGTLVHSKYLYHSVQHIALIVGTMETRRGLARCLERLTGYSQSLLDSGAPAPISRGTGSSNPSPASGESGANPGSREAARVLCRMNDRLFASLWKIARPRLVVAYQEHGARPSPMWQHRRLQLSAGK